jgi:hypothetical protein
MGSLLLFAERKYALGLSIGLIRAFPGIISLLKLENKITGKAIG